MKKLKTEKAFLAHAKKVTAAWKQTSELNTIANQLYSQMHDKRREIGTRGNRSVLAAMNRKVQKAKKAFLAQEKKYLVLIRRFSPKQWSKYRDG